MGTPPAEQTDSGMQTSVYNPLEPGFSENPFDQYERIRQGDRVQRTAFGPLLVHR
jgi:hypothetical protein